MAKKYLLVAARDPGAANVLTGFLSSWSELPKEQVRIWAMGKAIPLLSSLDLQMKTFPENVSEEELFECWNEDPPAAVLTGSSHYTAFEAHLWSFAERGGIDALCWIDYWSHLNERFRFGRPPRVIALDKQQAGQLANNGFKPSEIMVGGHPALRKMVEQRPKRKFGSQHQLGAEALRCLFISERFHGDVTDGLIKSPGFDEVNSFEIVHTAAIEVAERGNPVELTVKFHPYEETTRFREIVSEYPGHHNLQLKFLPPEVRLTDVLSDHDLAFGMCSIGLIEALISGVPAKSVQPNRIGTDLFPPSASGYVPVNTDPEVLMQECKNLMLSEKVRHELLQAYQLFLENVTGKPDSVAQWVVAKLAVNK